MERNSAVQSIDPVHEKKCRDIAASALGSVGSTISSILIILGLIITLIAILSFVQSGELTYHRWNLIITGVSTLFLGFILSIWCEWGKQLLKSQARTEDLLERYLAQK